MKFGPRQRRCLIVNSPSMKGIMISMVQMHPLSTNPKTRFLGFYTILVCVILLRMPSHFYNVVVWGLQKPLKNHTPGDVHDSDGGRVILFMRVRGQLLLV